VEQSESVAAATPTATATVPMCMGMGTSTSFFASLPNALSTFSIIMALGFRFARIDALSKRRAPVESPLPAVDTKRLLNILLLIDRGGVPTRGQICHLIVEVDFIFLF
jgi:hypothetical protein